MKKVLNIFLAIAACSLVLTSCQKETETFTPGDPDVSNCYGVFFPTQDASGSHTYDPDMDKSVEITVARANSSGDITVPVTVIETADGETTSGVFKVGDVSFADGQTETSVKVTFPDITEGVNYGLTLTVEDPQYASQYKEGAISIDFSVLCVKWEYFLNPKTGEKAVVTFTQDWWGETAWAYVKYYEVDGKRTCMTETFNHYYNSYYDDPGFWGYGSDYEWTFIWYTKYQNDKGFDLIRIPAQKSGYHHSTYDADVYVLDYFYWNADDPNDEAEFLSYAADNGDVVSYYDGNGGFFLSVRSYYMFGVGGWNPGAYDTIGIAEGFDRPDYSISLKAADPEDYVTKVTVTTGSTVDYIVYDVFEGTLNSSQIESKFVLFGEDEKLGKKVATDDSGVLTLDVKAENTGIYTLVAVSFGQDVESKKVVAKEYDSVSFNVEAEGQEVPVVVACGIDEVSLVNQTLYEINPDNSLEYYVYGEDLVDVKIAAISYMDVVAKGAEACAEAVSKVSSVSASVLEQINDGGYADITTGLTPGTEFYLFVYASNGYESTVIMSETTATTSGDPLMIYQNFDVNSYYEDGELESAKDWYGTWNYYATDYYGKTGMREYLGKVEISASKTETEGPDDYGFYDEYVYVDGLFPNAIPGGEYYGYEVGNCILEMDVYAGLMYQFNTTTVDGVCKVSSYAKGDGKWYNTTYCSAFIPVADGYYAFVDVSQYAASYNLCGLRVVQTYVWDAFYDLLLVDPAKDENGADPAFVNAAVAAAKARMSEAAREVTLTGNDKEDIHRILDRYNQKYVQNSLHPAGLNLQREAKVAPVTVTVSSVPARSSVKPVMTMAPSAADKVINVK